MRRHEGSSANMADASWYDGDGEDPPPIEWCCWRECHLGYNYHWERFYQKVQNCTVEEAWRYRPRAAGYNRCMTDPKWEILEENAKRYLVFRRERQRLVRQITQGANTLTTTFPREIVDHILPLMYENMICRDLLPVDNPHRDYFANARPTRSRPMS